MGHIIDFGTIDEKKVELAILKSGKFIVAVSSYGAALVWYGTKERNYVTYHKSAEDYENDST